MPRRLGPLLLAALVLAPFTAGAQAVAVGEPQAVGRSVSRDELARVKELWARALERAGLAVVIAKPKEPAKGAEFVASLAVDRDGDALTFTGLVSRVRIDRWSARAESRASAGDALSWSGSLDDVATAVARAIRDAPPRLAAQPPPRAKVQLKRAAGTPGAVAVPATADAPAAPVDAAQEAPADDEAEGE